MGIYDRDYARASSPGNARSRGGRGRPGGRRAVPGASFLGALSLNTWIIVINLVVFVVGLGLLSVPSLQREVPVRSEFRSVISPQSRDAARVDLSRGALPDPRNPLLVARPLVVVVAVPVAGGQVVNAPIDVGVMYFQRTSILEYWGHFSTARGFFGLEVWRFVTFQFLHANWTHLLFNLLGLWVFGAIVEEFLGSKRYAAYYLVCGVFGAALYLLLNLFGFLAVHLLGMSPGAVPFLLFDSLTTPLIGASAGIFGVLVAAARIAPNDQVLLMGIVPMRIWFLVVLMLLLSTYNLFVGSQNAGGEAAHLGGAIAGYFFIRRMHLLRDFFDVLGDSRRGAR